MGMDAQWWRWRTSIGNGIGRLVRTQRLRLLTMLATAAVMWSLIGGLTLGLLRFLDLPEYVSLKPRLVELILALFFFTLFIFVSASATVLVWTALYRGRSGLLLATLPVSDRQLWWCAALEGGAWAGWAVVVLVVPLIAVLAGDAAHPAQYLPAALAAVFGLIACCLAVGALVALAIARVMPALRARAPLVVAGAVTLLAAGIARTLLHAGHAGQLAFVSDALARLSFASSAWLPSRWAQAAIAAADAGDWREWADQLALLWTTAGMLAVVGEAWAGRRVRADLDALASRPPPPPRRRGEPWRLPPLVPADLALLVAKDLRLLRRDPVQVLQFCSFAGLLGFYVLMLPRLGHAFASLSWWRPVVTFLNLIAVTMALATFTGRFVYPLLALEGRRLWVLILAPIPRSRVVVAKTCLALLLALPVCLALVVSAGVLLGLPRAQIAYQAGTITALAVALTAGSLGLGAALADPQGDNAAALVAGYGGTMNLLLSLVLCVLVLTVAAMPSILHAGTVGTLLALAAVVVACGGWTWWGLSLAVRRFGTRGGG